MVAGRAGVRQEGDLPVSVAAAPRMNPPVMGGHRTRMSCDSAEMKLKLPAGSFKAYLFDCDGTVADSMPLHYIAWSKVLSEWNCEFSEDLFYAWGGMPVAEIIATLNEKHGLNMPVEDVSRRKKASTWKFFRSLKPCPRYWNTLRPATARFPSPWSLGARGIL